MGSRGPLGVILVVEDEWLIREDVVQELRAGGWEVLEASTAEGALVVLDKQQKIDVLVTDIQLAGYLNGWDVAEKFRAALPKVPVIYASGNAVERSRAVAQSLFFSKPYRTTDIVAACRKLASQA